MSTEQPGLVAHPLDPTTVRVVKCSCGGCAASADLPPCRGLRGRAGAVHRLREAGGRGGAHMGRRGDDPMGLQRMEPDAPR